MSSIPNYIGTDQTLGANYNPSNSSNTFVDQRLVPTHSSVFKPQLPSYFHQNSNNSRIMQNSNYMQTQNNIFAQNCFINYANSMTNQANMANLALDHPEYADTQPIDELAEYAANELMDCASFHLKIMRTRMN